MTRGQATESLIDNFYTMENLAAHRKDIIRKVREVVVEMPCMCDGLNPFSCCYRCGILKIIDEGQRGEQGYGRTD